MDNWSRRNGRASRRRTMLLAPSAPITHAARSTVPSAVTSRKPPGSRATSVTRALTSVAPARVAAATSNPSKSVRLATTSAPADVSSVERHRRRRRRGGVDESGGADADRRQAIDGQHRCHERQRASGDAAATRLLPRVRGIREHDAGPMAGKNMGGPRSGRARADHGNVVFHRGTIMSHETTRARKRQGRPRKHESTETRNCIFKRLVNSWLWRRILTSNGLVVSCVVTQREP